MDVKQVYERRNKLYYSSEKLNERLEYTTKVLSMGEKHWNILAQKTNNKARIRKRSDRDEAVLRQKFQKIAVVSKQTDTGYLPDNIRMAKKIAGEILGRPHPGNVGERNENLGDDVTDMTTDKQVTAVHTLHNGVVNMEHTDVVETPPMYTDITMQNGPNVQKGDNKGCRTGKKSNARLC